MILKKFCWRQKLIPVIIKNKNITTMLAWMDKKSFFLTLKTGFVFFWSRTRKSIWLKGLTSNNYQKVLRIFIDCDCDCILIEVNQINNICCHLGEKTCFKNEICL